MRSPRPTLLELGAATSSALLLVAGLQVEAAETSTRQPTVAFDQPSGFYENRFTVNLSTPVRGATICYTTNASAPGPSSLRYDGSIPVSTTTVLRATAFQDGIPLTDCATRTYLFGDSILGQNGGDLPEVWGTNSTPNGKNDEELGIPAHYALFQIDDGERRRIVAALRALPVLSIVAEREDLFSTQTGIYLHPLQRGETWERPAAIEMFGPGGQSGFRVGCGLRIHGGMSRRPEESPKHSFRLLFKRRHGAARLNFPVFGADGHSEFDELILRAGGSDSWLESNGERRRQATYVRDEWMRGSMAAMGYASARGRFVHVFLNGLYWGVYNLCERPGSIAKATDSPSRSVTDSLPDVLNAGRIESGNRVVWDRVMSLANSGLDDAERYQAISECLDLTQLADYLILNFYAGNSDWDRSANWYAIRPRIAAGRFQFFVWDAERTFGDVQASTIDFDDDESPMRLFHKLSENADFRALFAARAKRLLFDGGPLSPGPAAERFRQLADSLAPALAAESARWGSYRASVHRFKTGPYETLTVSDQWRREVDRVTSDYIPNRREVLVRQFRERGLFPEADGLSSEQRR